VTRFVDPGALFAGWVGFGMSVVVAVGLALVIAIQPLVFLFAPVGGLLIGYYANARSGRRRPLGRVLANALYAGVVTALCLVVLYAIIRLLFLYADTGTDAEGRLIDPTCGAGPSCTYARYVRAGYGPELEALGVTDARSFESYALREQLNGSTALLVLTLAGAAGGGLLYVLSGTASREAAARTRTSAPPGEA
jgi:hypothetical protein